MYKPKKVIDERNSCESCKYIGLMGYEEPCNKCNIASNQWKPEDYEEESDIDGEDNS
jgi:hypothetical protein